jgi:hypothetical protein
MEKPGDACSSQASLDVALLDVAVGYHRVNFLLLTTRQGYKAQASFSVSVSPKYHAEPLAGSPYGYPQSDG